MVAEPGTDARIWTLPHGSGRISNRRRGCRNLNLDWELLGRRGRSSNGQLGALVAFNRIYAGQLARLRQGRTRTSRLDTASETFIWLSKEGIHIIA
jgi:hypothetical protein